VKPHIAVAAFVFAVAAAFAAGGIGKSLAQATGQIVVLSSHEILAVV